MEHIFTPFALSDTSTGIMKENSTIFNIKDSVEPSYLYEATQFILETHKEFSEAKQELYKSIVEAKQDSDAIHESFSDFTGKIKSIIDKFLKFIKTIFAKFVVKFNSIIKSDKFLEKHKKDFSKFTADHNFDFEGYKFTIDEVEIKPIIFEDFEKDVQALRNTLSNDTTNVSKAAQDAYSALTDRLDSYFDEFRGKVIGSNNSIDSEDYQNKLFAAFRNFDPDKTILTIDLEYINTAMRAIEGYEKSIKNIERDKNNLDSAYNKVKKSVESFSKMKFDSSTKNYQATLDYGTPSSSPSYKEIPAEVKTKIDSFISKKAEQVEKCADIHVLVFASKLDAMKNRYSQDKTILYKALSKVTSFKEDASSSDYSPSLFTIDGETDDFQNNIIADTDISIDVDYLDNEEDNEIIDIVIDPEDLSDEDDFDTLAESFKDEKAKDLFFDFVSSGSTQNLMEAVYIESDSLIELNNGSTNMLLEKMNFAMFKKANKVAINVFKKKLAKVTNISIIDKYISASTKNIRETNKKLRGLHDRGKSSIVAYKMKNTITLNKEFVKIASERKAKLKKSLKESSTMDYSDMNIFNSFIVEKAILDDQTFNILNECLIFGDTSKNSKAMIESLKMINEGKLSQVAKDLFEKLKQFLNRIWMKFSEKAMKLFATDKAYLDKYKNTILKTKPQDGLKYEMPDHVAGIAAIQGCPIDTLKYDDSSKVELAKGLAYNLNKTVPNLNIKEDADYNTALKNMFISGTVEGGTKEFNADALNWTDIFNYCYNYKNMVSEIEKGKNVILQSHTEAERIISEMEKEENKNPTTESTYSAIFGRVITEDDAASTKVTINAPKDAPTSGASTSTNNTATSVAKNTNTVAPGEEKPDNADDAKDQQDAQKDLAKKAISGEIQQAKDNCKVYFDMVNSIIAAKMTAIETIRKNYMAIIYDHVNRSTGKNAGAQTTAKSGTDYSAGNTPEGDSQPLTPDEVKRLNELRSKVAKGKSTPEENQEFTALDARKNNK